MKLIIYQYQYHAHYKNVCYAMYVLLSLIGILYWCCAADGLVYLVVNWVHNNNDYVVAGVADGVLKVQNVERCWWMLLINYYQVYNCIPNINIYIYIYIYTRLSLYLISWYHHSYSQCCCIRCFLFFLFYLHPCHCYYIHLHCFFTSY